MPGSITEYEIGKMMKTFEECGKQKMSEIQITYHEEIPDLATYFELRTSVGWNNFSVQQAEKAIAGSVYFVLAKDGDLPVAMGRVIGDGMYYVIVDVAVRPEYQGKKIGSTIVEPASRKNTGRCCGRFQNQHPIAGGKGKRRILREAGV